jgi:hypothetical protein
MKRDGVINIITEPDCEPKRRPTGLRCRFCDFTGNERSSRARNGKVKPPFGRTKGEPSPKSRLPQTKADGPPRKMLSSLQSAALGTGSPKLDGVSAPKTEPAKTRPNRCVAAFWGDSRPVRAKQPGRDQSSSGTERFEVRDDSTSDSKSDGGPISRSAYNPAPETRLVGHNPLAGAERFIKL